MIVVTTENIPHHREVEGKGQDFGDVVRSLYFRPNGSFRRYGRPALVLTLILGTAALYWIVHRI